MRVASDAGAADRTLGDAPTSKPNLIDWQLMSGRTSFFPSLSQKWTCIVITVTNVRGPSAYVRHSDHTVTEVSQSDIPQRSSHHTSLHLRTGLSRHRWSSRVRTRGRLFGFERGLLTRRQTGSDAGQNRSHILRQERRWALPDVGSSTIWGGIPTRQQRGAESVRRIRRGR